MSSKNKAVYTHGSVWAGVVMSYPRGLAPPDSLTFEVLGGDETRDYTLVALEDDE